MNKDESHFICTNGTSVPKLRNGVFTQAARRNWKTDLPAGFDPDEHELMVMDGYNDCIVGVVERCGQDPIVCYDKEKIICRLQSDGLTRDEAEEFFYFNQIGAWVGESTPCFLSANEAHFNHHSYKGGVS